MMARTRPTTGPVCPVCRWGPNATTGMDAAPACRRHGPDAIVCTDPDMPTPTVPARRDNRWTR